MMYHIPWASLLLIANYTWCYGAGEVGWGFRPSFGRKTSPIWIGLNNYQTFGMEIKDTFLSSSKETMRKILEKDHYKQTRSLLLGDYIFLKAVNRFSEQIYVHEQSSVYILSLLDVIVYIHLTGVIVNCLPQWLGTKPCARTQEVH